MKAAGFAETQLAEKPAWARRNKRTWLDENDKLSQQEPHDIHAGSFHPQALLKVATRLSFANHALDAAIPDMVQDHLAPTASRHQER